MSKWAKRTIEAEIANAVVRIQREQQGRGPEDARVHILGDLVVARSSGVLTPNEVRLAATEEGRRLIKSARQELRYIAHQESEAVIARILECSVLRSYGDMDVEAAEMVEVYVLDTDIERKLLRHELDDLNGMNRPR